VVEAAAEVADVGRAASAAVVAAASEAPDSGCEASRCEVEVPAVEIPEGGPAEEDGGIPVGGPKEGMCSREAL